MTFIMYKQIFYPITVTLLLNLTLTQNLLGFQGYRGLSIHIMHKLYLYILTYNLNIPLNQTESLFFVWTEKWPHKVKNDYI